MSFQCIGIPKNLPSTVCRFFRWCELLSAEFHGIGYPKIYQSLGLTQLDILQVDRNDPLEMLFCWQTSQQSTTNPSFVTCHFLGTVPCGFLRTPEKQHQFVIPTRQRGGKSLFSLLVFDWHFLDAM